MQTRITNTRETVTAELYCHASAGRQPMLGRIRKRPAKRARNDQSRGRPVTPMNRRYR